MKLLVLGGTRFVGYEVVLSALSRGHEVTTFNRGQTAKGVHSGVKELYGDRDGGLDVLRGGTWDAVIDTCGYLPRLVRASGQELADRVGVYTFISSISVYKDLSVPLNHEHSDVRELEDESIEDIPNHYGALKARCEQILEGLMPGRVLTVRPGLIVGPRDLSDRFTYWPVRISRGGEILCPGQGDSEVQFIDVRDLAEWTVAMTEARRTGVYNAAGPGVRLTMRELLERAREALGSSAVFTWCGESFLAEQGVRGWSDMPVWLPAEGELSEFRGMLQADYSKAVQAGLTFRPVEETVRDTVRYHGHRGEGDAWKAGLSAARERELLALWHGGKAGERRDGGHG
ncbi:NAD-dependent epimerase/dehydratase family protein [Paenibacillus mucilaginosus]|uniref:NAD-dependent epimerase/dehydratase family protein n=1 Tax=Paenibacillus mucilaginosus (strain KNP414) TaxID=1036673 RepID=F8FEE1_PAEMK|nr:NAD-dependent epimerase/dehydratase family protein [Paenibacillus mucilaginosus]AEI44540.1 NAD-dependent epimerase/dehydratase family protein [Paenibacillus mucilaginosus KNP414]MCG7218123.1 NAD-dependent epimerase/dehydratase family protein [Paenibacillus mucilaginosus]WDM26123.1 NAD-dependent epimerase/dehydratase family protein [Paenibacillus mucilaginosus]